MVSERISNRKPTMDVLKPPENMHFDAGNVAEAWRRWEQQFKIYMTAAELSKKAKATRVAILLHTAGPEALDVFSTFQWEEEADKDDTDKVLQKFREYCQPRKKHSFRAIQVLGQKPTRGWVNRPVGHRLKNEGSNLWIRRPEGTHDQR